METDNAHVIALNRFTGELLWDTEIDDWHKNYCGLVGAAARRRPRDLRRRRRRARRQRLRRRARSGDRQGSLALLDGARSRGEPGSETWQGKDIDHGGAPTWFTGSYDPELDMVYWPTGNPSKEYNGDDRQGDNLYADCILALDRKTGALKWHYQFTPHDLWDWDATADVGAGRRRRGRGSRGKLMLHANRNGFFYVFDRRDGTLLLAKPFVTQPDVGERHRRRRPADQAAQPGADAGRHEGVPVAGRRDELVLSVVQPGDRALLPADVREVQHLHEARPGANGRLARAISADRRRPRAIRSRSGC